MSKNIFLSSKYNDIIYILQSSLFRESHATYLYFYVIVLEKVCSQEPRSYTCYERRCIEVQRASVSIQISDEYSAPLFLDTFRDYKIKKLRGFRNLASSWVWYSRKMHYTFSLDSLFEIRVHLSLSIFY